MNKRLSLALLLSNLTAPVLAAEPGYQAHTLSALEQSITEARQLRLNIQSMLEGKPKDAGLQESGTRLMEAITAWEHEMKNLQDAEIHEVTGSGSLRTVSAISENDAEKPQAYTPETGPLSNVLTGLDSWNLNENSISFGIAHADWTIDEVFPGTKLLMTGQYSFRIGQGQQKQMDCDCPPPPVPHRMTGTVSAHLQWGKGDTGLEYGMLSVRGLAYQRNYEPLTGQFKPLRDTLEWGVLRGGKDDPLGIDSYINLTLARLGRTWYWLSQKSPSMFTMGLGLSGGFAWADSVNDIYEDVSNPILGSWVTGAYTHPRWGKIYFEQRVINGFTLSSPSAGGPTSREARFRAGYLNNLKGCLSFELFIDKRSFNFSDHRLTDLYTKSKRTGLELSCAW